MSFFKKVFGFGDSSEAENPNNEPDIKFGRYSDTTKSKAQIDYWKESNRLFDNQQYTDAYEVFFKYLRDENLDNVRTKREGDTVRFEILQGSKRIIGTADSKQVVAESHIAKYNKLSVAFMRKLIEFNFLLRYSRFALKDDNICMKFDTSVLDGSPEKLYYAFKEVAIQADKQDDLLVEEFSMLEQVDNTHIVNIPEEQKNIKLQYLRKWIGEALQEIRKINENQFPGGTSYILLYLTYKIDYLITPEGKLMDHLEKIHRTYFANDGRSTQEKNQDILDIYQKIIEMNDDDIKRELYKTTATFGIVTPTPQEEFVRLIKDQINTVIKFRDDGYEYIARSILGYLPSYSLFYYGMPPSTKNLCSLIIRILNPEFYHELGFSILYYDYNSNQLNQEQITSEIERIIQAEKVDSPKLNIDISKLKFDTRINFIHSFLNEICNLDYSQEA